MNIKDNNRTPEATEQTRPPLHAQESDHQKNPPQPATNIPHQHVTPENNPQQTRDNPALDGSSPSHYSPAFGPLGYLNSLPPEKQAYVREIMGEYSLRRAAEILSGPPPDGLGRLITHDTLFRFGQREKRENRRHRLETLAQLTLAELDDPAVSDQHLSAASIRYLRASLLESVTKVQGINMIEAVHKMLNQLRRTDLAERKIALAEKSQTQLAPQ